MKNKDLEKSIKMYDVIEKYFNIHGYAPSVRNIGAMLGISSTSTVHRRLNKLEELGWISKDKNITRSITLNSITWK